MSDLVNRGDSSREVEELKRTIERMEQAAKIGAWKLDVKTHQITWTDQVFRIHGLNPDRDEVPSLEDAIKYYAPEYRDIIEKAVNRSIDTAEAWDYELQIITAQGQRLWVRAMGQAEFENGELACLSGTFMDIHQEVVARQQLIQFEKLAEKTTNGVIMTDAERKIVWVNRAFEELTGYEQAEVVGKSPGQFLQGEDTDAGKVIAMREALNQQKAHQVELVNYSKDGDRYVVQLDIQPLFSEAGVLTNFMAIQANVTTQKQYEEDLVKAKEEALEAAEVKSSFLATMSHEIRTPMNGVLGMAQVLCDTPLNSEQQEMVRTIRNSGEALLGILNDILDISKIESGKMEIENTNFDLHEACSDVISLFRAKAESKNLVMRFHYELDYDYEYHGDPGRIRQILLNLVSNAIKFTEQGGIDVNVYEIMVKNRPYVLFRVTDSGLGISEEGMGRLFQAFSQADASTTRKFGGSGLGLVISQELCQLMEGEIGVESKEGVGSSFWFRLPLKRRKIQSLDRFSGIGVDSENIFIMNETQEPLDLLYHYLHDTHFRPERIDAYESFRFPEIEWDEEQVPSTKMLILIDRSNLDSSKRMQRLLRENRGLRLCVLAQEGIPGDGLMYKEMGVSAYIVHPFRAAELRGLLNAMQLWNDGDELLTRYNFEDFQSRRPSVERRILKLLLVEDNAINQKVALKMLQRMGHSVDVAANGIEALEMVESFTYDLIFMDCMMPEMDGYEATRRIRSREDDKKNITIVAMTANVMEKDVQACLDCGMNEVLGKPVKKERLDQLLQTIPLHGSSET